jgi:hypothetical protein
MAVVMTMDWDGVTREQYEAVRELVRWDSELPDGAKVHVAGFDDAGMHVTDVWDSQEEFDRFMHERLGAGIEEVGIDGQPNVRFLTLGAVFIPALEYAQADTI